MANISHQESTGAFRMQNVSLVAAVRRHLVEDSAHNLQGSKQVDYQPEPSLSEESDDGLAGTVDRADNGSIDREEEPVYRPEKSKAADRASKSFKKGLRKVQKRLSSVFKKVVCPYASLLGNDNLNLSLMCPSRSTDPRIRTQL